MIVKDLMCCELTTAPPETKLSVAISLMGNKKRSCVIITDHQVPVGIITERDVVGVVSQAISNNGFSDIAAFDDITVAEVMTIQPVRLLETTSLNEAVTLSNRHQLRHFPVTDTLGQLVGIVTQTDIVKAYIAIIEKQAQLEATNQELASLAHEDSLLGISNRRAMELDMSRAQSLSNRLNGPYAVALFDVDYFKKYNDQYGHQAGDRALVAITNAIKDSLRESDRIYRYGGEELLVLMPDTNEEGAVKTAERARVALESLQLPHTQSPSGYLSVSAGVASTLMGNWQNLVKEADQALYQAKADGRNRVVSSVKRQTS